MPDVAARVVCWYLEERQPASKHVYKKVQISMHTSLSLSSTLARSSVIWSQSIAYGYIQAIVNNIFPGVAIPEVRL